ncbi:glucose-6-phosphate dehydrogenase [Streptomyces sp. 049-1]|uniref:glucose-6-phosphate dehydrogenase n=1 Tax=Streptomyces sp. 049-1 TaxID=2789264 RepID=UPI0039807C40
MTRPDDHVIVLFGATGDLARRKLIPGLFNLARAGLLPDGYRIVGSAPTRFALTDGAFREHARAAVSTFGPTVPAGPEWNAFEEALSFGAADPSQPGPLLDAVRGAERALGRGARRLFHLAVPPPAFPAVVALLGDSGLAQGSNVIIEKPFGVDLESARSLNETVHAVFDESRIFRIDHFLGKESVDNILALRLANSLFEPIWNRDHITHVQIDVPETIGLEGRAQFYEGTGAVRDMIVTHLIQVLGIVAMDPPGTLDAHRLRDEKVKVFEALRPIRPSHAIRGQYEGYRQEPGVAPDSQTETFAALRVEVDNWRWAGVPFYLRSGKRLAEHRETITLGLREPAMSMFGTGPGRPERSIANRIVIDFADPGWIGLEFLAKVPGPTMNVGRARMEFRYGDSFCRSHGLQGYERLILDAMSGDQSLFTRADGIEYIWAAGAPLLATPPPLLPYAPGTWGPQPAVDQLAAPHYWYLPERSDPSE